MKTKKPSYLGSDAWLLTAIYGASLGDGEASLGRVIAIGDFINHAIFTLAEMNGGLSRLEKGGYITIQDQLYELTQLGSDTTVQKPKDKQGAFRHMEAVRKRLGASDWGPRTDPNAAGDPDNPRVYVTEEMFQTAFKEYKASLKKRPKPKKANKPSGA